MKLAQATGGICLLAALLTALGAMGREPTEFEQYTLERLNFARAFPLQEVARLSHLPWGDDGLALPDLNEGLAPGTISSDPKQPLAFNPNLIDAASDYSDDLLASREFTHELGGTNPGGRMVDAGYRFAGSSGWGENLAVTASSGSHDITLDRVDIHHTNLFIDDGISGRGHRTSIMKPAWREVGIGVRASTSSQLFLCCPNAVLTTQDFAFTRAAGGGPYITGVAFDDLDGNRFYTPQAGEALGGFDVTVFNSEDDRRVASTTTLGSGGYKVGGFGAGTYDVRFSGPDVEAIYRNIVFDGVLNFKLDAIDPGSPTSLSDLTRDGFVDFDDLAVLLSNWDKDGRVSGNLFAADDTRVNFDDLAVLLTDWTGPGVASPPQAALAAAAVPEPSTAVLAVLAALGVACYRRRHRSRRQRLRRALGYLRPVDYYRGDPQQLHEARRLKLSHARHRRKEKNLQLRQPALPLSIEEIVS